MNSTQKDTKRTGYTGKRWPTPVNNQNYANTLVRKAEPRKWTPTREIRVNPHELIHSNEYNFGSAFEQPDVPHRTDMRRISQGGFRFRDVVRNYYDFDNEWVDHHSNDYTDDSTNYAKVEMSTSPEIQQLSGSSFPQVDVPCISKFKRVSNGGFRFSGVVRNVYDYEDPKNDDWMFRTSEHPEFQIKTKSREFRMPGTLRADDFDNLDDKEQEDMESHVEYNWGFAFLQDDVPHVSLEKKVSRGGYRFHGVVRNIYDYDADASEDDLTTFVELRPHHQRRTKSKDYRKPGTIRAGFDTDEQIYRARKSSVDQIPDISSATKNTLSYFKEQVGKNAPSKWEELAPQPKITNISSREKGGTEYLKGNYAQGMPEQSTSGVADTLAYYQQKVAPPKPQKKPTEIADTLSYFHQKVAPKQPVMQMETPTHPPEGAYIRTNQTDANVKRTKINRGRESGSFFSSVEDIDEHRSHANDYGTRHHSRFEEFSNNKGCDMYIVNEEKYSELFHPGKG